MFFLTVLIFVILGLVEPRQLLGGLAAVVALALLAGLVEVDGGLHDGLLAEVVEGVGVLALEAEGEGHDLDVGGREGGVVARLLGEVGDWNLKMKNSVLVYFSLLFLKILHNMDVLLILSEVGII